MQISVVLGGEGMFVSQSHSALNRRALAWSERWSLPGALCARLIGIAAFIVIIQALGPWSCGVFLFVQWLAKAPVPVIGVGASMLANRQVSEIQSREIPRMSAGIFYCLWYRQCRNGLLYCLACILLALPLSWIFAFCNPTLMLLAVLSTLPLLLSGVAGITLRSLRRSDLLTGLHLFGALSTLVCALIAAQMTAQVVSFLLAVALAGALTLIVALICIVRLLPLEAAMQPGPFLLERLQKALRPSLLLFAVDSVVWQPAEMLLLACWRTPVEVGLYALSAIISSAVMGFISALFSTWMLPLILRYRPEHRYLDEYSAFISNSRYITLLAIALCSVAILLCPIAITFCLGPAYLPIIDPLRILLISAACGSIASVSMAHLARKGWERAQLRLGIAAALLNIALALPCVALWGATGAALAAALAQFVSAIGAVCLCSRALICRP
jgi:O-antigen/teichoic acid export membrane protein